MKSHGIAFASCLLLVCACVSSTPSGPTTDGPTDVGAKDNAGDRSGDVAGSGATDRPATSDDTAAGGPETQGKDGALSEGRDAGTTEDEAAGLGLDAARETAVTDVAAEGGGADGPVADGPARLDVGDGRGLDLGSAVETPAFAPDLAAEVAMPSDFPCRRDSDCCIEIDTCMNVAYLYSKAPGAAPAPSIPPSTGWCTACIPPAIQVRCVSGQCIGERIATYDSPLLFSHCGPVALPDGGMTALADVMGDGGAAAPKSVWTCGG